MGTINTTGGTLDMTTAALRVRGSSLATVMGMLNSGIIKSAASGVVGNVRWTLGVVDGTLLRGLGGSSVTVAGLSVAEGDVLLRYTMAGDTNLDGQITADDYLATDIGYLLNITGWAYGDFNGDGRVDASDYHDIDQAMANQNRVAGEQMATLHETWFGENYGLTTIPEPGTLGVLAAAIAAMLRRGGPVRKLPVGVGENPSARLRP